MSYPTLEKLFYMNSSSDRFSLHDQQVHERLAGDSTFRTGIKLEHGELFLAVPRDLSLATEQVLRRERRVSSLWRDLPPVALGAFIRSLIMDEVVYSNEIEGVNSTRRQIEAALEHARTATPQRKSRSSEGMHTPFVEFARLYLQLTDEPAIPVALEDIRHIYDAVVADTIDERNLPETELFRTGPVEIVNQHGRTVHTGITPEAAIEEYMRQWIGLSQSMEIPELYSGILCHFLFGYIHPFYDGNGRTGRYLLALHLSRPLSQPTVLSLSRVIAENKAAYYRAFDTTEKQLNAAEGTHFVLTMLDLIARAQEELIANLEEKQTAIVALRQRIEEPPSPYTERLRATLFYAAQMHLYNTLQEIRLDALASYLGVSSATARKALTELESRNILEKVSHRPPIYRLSNEGLAVLGIR